MKQFLEHEPEFSYLKKPKPSFLFFEQPNRTRTGNEKFHKTFHFDLSLNFSDFIKMFRLKIFWKNFPSSCLNRVHIRTRSWLVVKKMFKWNVSRNLKSSKKSRSFVKLFFWKFVDNESSSFVIHVPGREVFPIRLFRFVCFWLFFFAPNFCYVCRNYLPETTMSSRS